MHWAAFEGILDRQNCSFGCCGVAEPLRDQLGLDLARLIETLPHLAFLALPIDIESPGVPPTTTILIDIPQQVKYTSIMLRLFFVAPGRPVRLHRGGSIQQPRDRAAL